MTTVRTIPYAGSVHDESEIDAVVEADGLPHADAVMEQGLILPCHHAMDDADVDYLCDTVDAFLEEHR